MDLQLTGKTALVTGASVGIGRAIAQGLAAEGVTLCIAARRRELLEELAAQIAASGRPQPSIVSVDLVQDGAPQELARLALQALGRIDILVNSAGGGQGAITLDVPDAAWGETMSLNYDHVRRLTHAVLPSMIEHRWGRVINISGKSEPPELNAAYPSKAALHAWSKGLSREVGKHGITVNCVAPGRIMSEQILRKYTPAFRAEQAAREIPVGRYGEPEELACLAVFLASPLAAYITGTVMPVDGGLRRYAF